MSVLKVVFFALFSLGAFACGSMMVGVSSFSCETEGDCLSGYRCLNGECVEGGGSASSSSSGSSAPSSSSLISNSSRSGSGASHGSGSSRSSSTTASSGASSVSSSSPGSSSRQSSSAGTSFAGNSSSTGGQSSSFTPPSSSVQMASSQGTTSAGVSSSVAGSSSAATDSSAAGNSSSAGVSSSASNASSGASDPCLDAPKLVQISCVQNVSIRECTVTGLTQAGIWLMKPYPPISGDTAVPTRLAVKHETSCQTSNDTCSSTPWTGTVDDFTFPAPVGSHVTVCVTNAPLTVNDPVHGYDVDTCLDLCRASLSAVDAGIGNVGQWYPSETIRDSVFISN